MKKITRANFEGLRQRYPVLNKEKMRRYVGGNSTTLYDESDLALLNVYTLDIDMDACSAVGSDKDDEMEEDVWTSDLGISVFSADDYGASGYGFYGGSGGGSYRGHDWDIDGGYLDEVVIYGSNNYGYMLPEVTIYGEKPDNVYPDWYYYAPWGEDLYLGDYDDHSYPWGGYYDGYYIYNNWNGNSGGGGGSSSGPSSNSLTDGVNIENFTFNTESEAAFHEQLTKILESNSILKNLLSYMNKGYVHLTFSISEMNQNVPASTDCSSDTSFCMTFNTQFINEDGWNRILKGDNIGYDWNKVKTKEEALVVILAHEAQHANHIARYYDVTKQANGDAVIAARIFREQGYSQEFVNIFIDENTHKYKEYFADGLHDYMKKYNHGVIDTALDEYRNDFK